MAHSDGEGGKLWYWCLSNTTIISSLGSAILDEFAQVEPGEPQLKFCIRLLRLLDASLDMTSERVKNNERAREYRDTGNQLFSSNEHTAKVAEIYTKSIAHALPGSRELALAYANRSAVSYKAENYEDCLLDIDRSFENDYPEDMTAKLYARRVRCLVALKKSQTEIEKALEDTREALLKMELKASGRNLIEKTLTDGNHMAPTISTKKTMNRLKPTIQDDSCDIRGATGIAVQYSKKYGRHIVATRDIQPGEIIAVIDNYATTQNLDECYHECAHCTNETTVGIPCDHCVNVIYCSTSCRDKAWNDYHKIECPILGKILDLEFPKTAILGIKITLKAVQEAGSVIELKKVLKRIDSISDPRLKGFTDNILDCTKYAYIYTLTSHAGKHLDSSYVISIISTFTVYYLATQTETFGQKHKPDLQVFNKNPLLSFLGGLMIRNCEIVQMTGAGGKQLGGDDLQIAPFTALCNHSCDSNVTSLGTNKNIVFALQPIKAGDQIWDTYGGLHYSNFPREERQKILKDHYFFTCDCVACIEDWPMFDKLPSAFEKPGLSPAVAIQLSELESTFWRKVDLGLLTGDVLAAKDELVQMIQLLFKHAGLSKEMITYRQELKDMHGSCLDPF